MRQRWQHRIGRRAAAIGTAGALVLAQVVIGAAPAAAADPVTLNILTINDFHGRINSTTVQFAGTVEQLRQAAGPENTLLVGAGDLIGASEFASAVAEDQPTIDVMNELGMNVSAVGNHEFDKGFADLTDRVITENGARNAKWDYLGANVYQAGTTTPALPEYGLYQVGGLTVGVIGVVTEETPTLVSPAGVSMLSFGDPVEAINRVAAQLKDGNPANGEADVLIATLHEGAPTGAATLDQNVANSPVFAEIVNGTSASVAAIVNGHTHQAYAYQAPVPGQPGRTRPIIQTGQYAANVGQITITYDPDAHQVTSASAANVARTTVPKADLIAQFPDVLGPIDTTVSDALANAETIGNQPVGKLTADITTAYTNPQAACVQTGQTGPRDDRAAESTLGNLVANALRDSLQDPDRGEADFGVVNPGGLRADLCYAANPANTADGDGVIQYAEANGVLPFLNNLGTTSLTGAQVKTMLEQQWQRDANGNIPTRPYLQLGLSDNVTYTFDPALPEGSRITSITVDKKPIDPAATYRVGTFSFLLAGGDNFRVFTQGTNTTDSGLIDRDAWTKYLTDNSPISPSFARHAVQVKNLPTTLTAGAAVSFDVAGLDLTSVGSPANVGLSGTLISSANEKTELGPFTVVGGATTVKFDLPTKITSGTATLELTAAPTGTKVTIPLMIKATSSVALTANPNTQVFGVRNGITLTATVTSSEPAGGTVEFRSGGQLLGTADVKNGTATLPLPAGTAAGSYDVVAHYSGADAVPAADSAPVKITVVRATSTTLLAPGLSLPFVGTLLIGAVVLNNGQPAAGTVQIAGNGTAVGSAPVQRSGLFAFLAPRAGKSTTFTATFVPADPTNISGSTSNPVVVRR